MNFLGKPCCPDGAVPVQAGGGAGSLIVCEENGDRLFQLLNYAALPRQAEAIESRSPESDLPAVAEGENTHESWKFSQKNAFATQMEATMSR